MKDAARRSFHAFGGLRVARWMKRNGLRILMYHRFPDGAGLKLQCRHLREHYRPVSLGEVAGCWRAGRSLPANSLAITVDDGYRDFLDIAHPVFAGYGIPTTVYVVTGFLDGELWIWIEQVLYAFRNTRLKEVRIEMPGGLTRQFTLTSTGQREAAGRELCEALKLLPNEERLAVLRELPRLLEVEISPQAPPGCEPLTWDEVRRLAREGVEFGAHTRTHPILSRVESPAELDAEIAGSKRRLEEVLGQPVRHFCYPNGSERDISEAAMEAVRRAGYQTAVTTITGVNPRGADLFRLRRIGVDPGYEFRYFQQCAAAFRV